MDNCTLKKCWEWGKPNMPHLEQCNINNFYTTSAASSNYFHRHQAVHYGNQLQVNDGLSFSECSSTQLVQRSLYHIDTSITNGNYINCYNSYDIEKPFVFGTCGQGSIVVGQFQHCQRCYTGENLYTFRGFPSNCNQKVTLTRHGRRSEKHHKVHSAYLQRTHERGRIYPCRICLKKFTTANDARRHEDSVHTGLKPFKCIACGKAFPRKDNCRRHMLICKVQNGQVTQQRACFSIDAINFGQVPTTQVVDDFVGVVGLRSQYWSHAMQLRNFRNPSENTAFTGIAKALGSVDSEPLDLRMWKRDSNTR